MSEPMHPFDWPEFNKDSITRNHAVPNTVFDYQVRYSTPGEILNTR
jgi:hypothetical protein